MKAAHAFKVMTCCYCGARSSIGLGKTARLVCHGCGAPISRIETVQPILERQKKGKRRTKVKPSIPHRAERPHQHLDKDRPARRRKGKRKRRSVWYHVAEAFDDWDDWFEDIVDFFD